MALAFMSGWGKVIVIWAVVLLGVALSIRYGWTGRLGKQSDLDRRREEKRRQSDEE
jgi:hypothetical protein